MKSSKCNVRIIKKPHVFHFYSYMALFFKLKLFPAYPFQIVCRVNRERGQARVPDAMCRRQSTRVPRRPPLLTNLFAPYLIVSSEISNLEMNSRQTVHELFKGTTNRDPTAADEEVRWSTFFAASMMNNFFTFFSNDRKLCRTAIVVCTERTRRRFLTTRAISCCERGQSPGNPS